MGVLAAAVLVGLVAGILSGMFGVGGGLLTTPALRLLLGAPALIALGTPLPVIIPTAITGALAHDRRGTLDRRAGLAIGLAGAASAVAGARLSGLAGGSAVMVITAALILYMAADMLAQVYWPGRIRPGVGGAHTARMSSLLVAGGLTGLLSGFLGLGGGFVIVPVLTRWFGFPVKRAIGTSLAAISIMAIPGSIAHYMLGHVDVALALSLTVSVVPGALLGARLAHKASDRSLRVGFALLLVISGAALAINEIGVLT